MKLLDPKSVDVADLLAAIRDIASQLDKIDQAVSFAGYAVDRLGDKLDEAIEVATLLADRDDED